MYMNLNTATCFLKIISIVLTVKCTKTHIYYAMKNCNGDADELKRYIINIVDHYQVKGFSGNLSI